MIVRIRPRLLVTLAMVVVACSSAGTSSVASHVAAQQPTSAPVGQLIATAAQSLMRVVVLVEEPNGAMPVVNGSAFVVGSDGLIVTAAHVVDGISANALLVVAADVDTFDRDVARATVVAINRDHDIAFLRAQAAQGRPGLSLESPRDLMAGEDAFVLGFPLGDPVLTASRAMIAAKSFKIFPGASARTEVLKLDASVNRGLSGGPVIRAATGRVIGMVSLKEGSLQERLQTLLREQPKASISIGGNDPIQLLQLVVADMERNLQLGIGYAVSSDYVAEQLRSIR